MSPALLLTLAFGCARPAPVGPHPGARIIAAREAPSRDADDPAGAARRCVAGARRGWTWRMRTAEAELWVTEP